MKSIIVSIILLFTSIAVACDVPKTPSRFAEEWQIHNYYNEVRRYQECMEATVYSLEQRIQTVESLRARDLDDAASELFGILRRLHDVENRLIEIDFEADR